LRVPVKLGLFALGLAAAFGLGAAAGAVVPDQSGSGDAPAGHGPTGGDDSGPQAHTTEGMAELLGLPVAAGGYRLDVSPGSGPSDLRFRILGADDSPVVDFVEENEALLHLIVVRRDMSGFQHLHPVLDAGSGIWSARVELDGAGSWRLIVDAVAVDRGEPTPVILGADVDVDGEFAAEPLPAPTERVGVDGYDLTLVEPPTTEQDQAVVVSVERDGAPVTDLEPYLGNAGHLVALRAGDLAYTHLHSSAGTGGPELRFAGGLPSSGTYRLFVQFADGDAVHTAAFTVEVAS
jgi:hypothetical protein